MSPPGGTTTSSRVADQSTFEENIETGLEGLLLGSKKMDPSFDTTYTLGKKLQGGSYGTVFVGVHNLSEKEYAVKVVDRRLVLDSFDVLRLGCMLYSLIISLFVI